ncbi:phosphotransferase [Geothrix oryzae]|uniref:phosphotransferase n=1 Tax=Geothrix oryzae TaxID=2927975 RepID=UPI002572BEF4|nr:phosphotransferase [Geothrix oryzae]
MPPILKQSLLDVEYLKAGMQVGVTSVPVLLMTWQEGQDLLQWARTAANNPGRIEAFQGRFRALARAMQQVGFIHGDLQHGNLMVSQRDLPVLVDYDNLLLPGSRSLGVTTFGLEGFQHPGVGSGTPHHLLDRLPILVIDTALEILKVNRALLPGWETIDGMLFQASDLRQPNASALFQAMEGERALQGCARQLALVLAGPVDQIPTLDEFLKRVSAHAYRPRLISWKRPSVRGASAAPVAVAPRRWKVPAAPSGLSSLSPRLVQPGLSWAQASLRQIGLGGARTPLVWAMALALIVEVGMHAFQGGRPVPTDRSAKTAPARPAPLRLREVGPSKTYPHASGTTHLSAFEVLEVPAAGTSAELPQGDAYLRPFEVADPPSALDEGANTPPSPSRGELPAEPSPGMGPSRRPLGNRTSRRGFREAMREAWERGHALLTHPDQRFR